jgi:hypothetical protein
VAFDLILFFDGFAFALKSKQRFTQKSKFFFDAKPIGAT